MAYEGKNRRWYNINEDAKYAGLLNNILFSFRHHWPISRLLLNLLSYPILHCNRLNKDLHLCACWVIAGPIPILVLDISSACVLESIFWKKAIATLWSASPPLRTTLHRPWEAFHLLFHILSNSSVLPHRVSRVARSCWSHGTCAATWSWE